MIGFRGAILVLVALGVSASGGSSEGLEIPSPAEAKRRWQGRLHGVHFSARVSLVIRRGEDREERVIDVWRDDETQGHRERLMARFDSPPDLRGLGLLYLENEDQPNDYFLYQPATQRVRRVPEALAKEDVYGVDLEYLGFGVAQIEPTELDSLTPEAVDGRPAFRLTERALAANPRFEERVVWLDASSFVPLRTEHRRLGKTTLAARTETLREIHGVVTPMRVIFERLRGRESVEMSVERIDYEQPIPSAFFSTLSLIKR